MYVCVYRHVFHKGCVDEWLLVNASCPTCRKGINEHTSENTAVISPMLTHTNTNSNNVSTDNNNSNNSNTNVNTSMNMPVNTHHMDDASMMSNIRRRPYMPMEMDTYINSNVNNSNNSNNSNNNSNFNIPYMNLNQILNDVDVNTTNSNINSSNNNSNNANNNGNNNMFRIIGRRNNNV